MFSALKYGASAADYFEFEFYDKKAKFREQFCCWKLKKRFMHTANDYTKADIFNDKAKFLTTYKNFIGREWLDMRTASLDEFVSFSKSHVSFIAKPLNQSCGRGVHKVSSDGDLSLLYKQLVAEQALLEEIIVQNKKMDSIWPGCVNTVRVPAVYINGRVDILGAALRCGNGSDVIDNYCAGGFAAKIDYETGIVVSDGVNINHERVERHPSTHVLFHGFQIPNWDKVKKLISDAGEVVDGVRYVGWDVAIRENDVILVEGNFEGMFNLPQVPANKGIKKKIISLMNEFNE